MGPAAVADPVTHRSRLGPEDTRLGEELEAPFAQRLDVRVLARRALAPLPEDALTTKEALLLVVDEFEEERRVPRGPRQDLGDVNVVDEIGEELGERRKFVQQFPCGPVPFLGELR